MAFELKMPQLGLTMEEGTVSKWVKHEGDAVKTGEVILEITTDKLTNEVTSEVDGTLLKIVAQEGEDVPVKGTLAWIGQPGEAVGGEAAAPAVPFAPASKDPAAAAATAAPVKPAGDKSVIVIGGGPGGYVAAIRAAQLGAKVTVVEKQYLGGTCLNVGCIPTKCLLHSAELVEDIKNQGKEIGVEVEGVKVNFPQVIAHKNEISKKLTSGVAGLLKMNKVKKVDGEASFTAPGKLSVKKADGTTEAMTADAIIIATGSVNAIPPIPGIQENPNCIDSTGALSLEALPKSMVVIGGGVIGLELACAYAAFGTKITVVEAMDHMLPMLDGDLTKIGVAHMKKMGMEFHLECPVQSVEASPAGAKVVCKNKAGETVSFEAEKVLVAIGRKANTASLNLDAGGLKNDRGRILVNDRMETNVPGVYAIGDCVFGKAQLAHTASAMGEVAAENIMGIPAEYDEKTNPTCVYIEPEAASVGLTEEQCKAKGISYKVGKFPMSANGKALILNGGEGLVKIIAGTEFGEILGMHIIGPRATDLIAEGALAIGEEMTLDEIISTIHSHPTVTETMREAALQAEKRAIHTSNK
ncbi:MAG: dihydrolipoyl dehydrogenase [Oscillibacter sp.]|jgi:dihydrolipoamide dehydrogenase|nr:dihydrolipoyl dehydrogenase [Oscillibacter sp.]